MNMREHIDNLTNEITNAIVNEFDLADKDSEDLKKSVKAAVTAYGNSIDKKGVLNEKHYNNIMQSARKTAARMERVSPVPDEPRHARDPQKVINEITHGILNDRMEQLNLDKENIPNFNDVLSVIRKSVADILLSTDGKLIRDHLNQREYIKIEKQADDMFKNPSSIVTSSIAPSRKKGILIDTAQNKTAYISKHTKDNPEKEYEPLSPSQTLGMFATNRPSSARNTKDPLSQSTNPTSSATSHNKK
jgi:hypothetical protein